ncbi:proline racemase, partial [Vibrio parahaemolyticus]|nr:proline racemase [Vibrio parahaemolyticus]
SAKLALMYEKNEIMLNERIRSMSVLGSTITGNAIKEVKIGNYRGIIPEITGRAYITAYNNLVLEDGDIFEYGIDF